MTVSARAPKPRFPKVPKVITLEEILPAIRKIAARKNHSYEYPGLDVKPGKKYVMLCDRSNDKTIKDALTIAITEAGGSLNTITLEGYSDVTDSVELLDSMFSHNWIPKWAWEAMAEADVVIMNAFLLANYTPNPPIDLKKKDSIMMFLTPDLCLPQVLGFPFEVRDALDRKTWELMVNAKTAEMTDLEGTELRWTMSRPGWDKTIARNRDWFGVDHYPGHLMAPILNGDAEGKLVTSAITFGGPVPRTTFNIKGSQVYRVDGEGKLAETWRRNFEEYKNLKSPTCPGPGINWWTTLAIGTSPKARIAANWDKMSGCARMHAWGIGHSRSGVVHTSIGEGVVAPDRRIIRHVDIFFPTLICDGKKVIEGGHLVALDDPAIIKLAAKYGDPEELLREDWIPAVEGVNA